MKIDLKELALRESERVEWKENGSDKFLVKEIVKTISAFANDIANVGGGYVVCGAKEGKDAHGFPKVFYTGLTANKVKEIIGKVTQECRDCVSPSISPLVTELNNPNDDSTKILVFTTIASSDAHTYRDGTKSVYYVRIASDTREARNGILTQLLIKKRKIEYFDKTVNEKATDADIDKLIFRDYIQEMGLNPIDKSLEDYFSDREQLAEFIPPLFSSITLDNSLHPKNFSLLMFGKKQSITRLFPDAYTVFSVYGGQDRSEPTAERHLLTGTLIEQARKAIELLNAATYVAFDKLNEKPNQVKYPIRALQEAVVNAIVHRDYELPEPNRITVFIDRVEIRSPGALHWTVDKEKFKAGKASPKWRNQSFTYLFNKMQLAQSEGQGIPTILRTMREEGCPEPIFELEQESVTCILPAHPRHQTIRALQQVQDDIVLENYFEALEKLDIILNKDPYNFRALDLLVELSIKRKDYLLLFYFLDNHKPDLYAINSNTLLNIAEVLATDKSNKEVQNFASKILNIALSGRLAENQIIKAAISLKKMGTADEVIKFISESFVKYPRLANNATLLEKRATSKMDLAKKCINTGRNQTSSPKTKARAWEMCRELLNEAERDLSTALDNTENPSEKYYIEQDFEFLEKLKKTARKPSRKE